MKREQMFVLVDGLKRERSILGGCQEALEEREREAFERERKRCQEVLEEERSY